MEVDCGLVSGATYTVRADLDGQGGYSDAEGVKIAVDAGEAATYLLGLAPGLGDLSEGLHELNGLGRKGVSPKAEFADGLRPSAAPSLQGGSGGFLLLLRADYPRLNV